MVGGAYFKLAYFHMVILAYCVFWRMAYFHRVILAYFGMLKKPALVGFEPMTSED